MMIWPLAMLADRAKRKRGLFPYWDGERKRWADPFTIYRGLSASDVDLESMAPAIDEQKEPETTQAIDCICQAFDVSRWSDKTCTGLTDWEILGLVEQLDNYVNGVKKKSSPGLT